MRLATRLIGANDFAIGLAVDLVVLESTYGDRVHPPMAQTLDALAAALRRVLPLRVGGKAIALRGTRVSPAHSRPVSSMICMSPNSPFAPLA